MRSAVVVGVCFLLAGCLQGTAEPPKTGTEARAGDEVPAAFARISAAVADLPCTASNVPRDGTSSNVRGLAHLPVESATTPRTMGEADRKDSMVVQAFYTDEGFRLVNLTDPEEPTQVGVYYVSAGSDTYDVKFSRLQPFVIVGFSNRVQIVDVSDPMLPRLVHELRHPPEYRGQAHMIYPYVIEGTEYLFIGPSISGTGLMVQKITGQGVEARLEVVRVYASTGPHAVYPQALAPHDTFATFDAAYGHHLLYVANSFNGMVIMQIDDPADAQVVTSLPAAQAPPPTGLLPNHYHTIQSAWILDKRIVATVSEVGYNTMKVFDATDLKNVRFMGEWVHDRTQPAKLQHNFQIVNSTLLMGHYEHGMYVFDLSEFVAQPSRGLVPVAHYQPPPGGLVWDVLVWNGLILLSDIPQGLHVLAYGCFTPGAPELTSRG